MYHHSSEFRSKRTPAPPKSKEEEPEATPDFTERLHGTESTVLPRPKQPNRSECPPQKRGSRKRRSSLLGLEQVEHGREDAAARGTRKREPSNHGTNEYRTNSCQGTVINMGGNVGSNQQSQSNIGAYDYYAHKVPRNAADIMPTNMSAHRKQREQQQHGKQDTEGSSSLLGLVVHVATRSRL